MNRSFMTSALICAFLATGSAVVAQDLNMGDDSNDFANDGECDDPRFAGPGMASSFDAASIGTDATDCTMLLNAKEIRLVRTQEQSSPEMCAEIVFGDDSSDWAKNGECDDPRFTGPKSASIVNVVDRLKDATDCRLACEAGFVWRR